MKNPNIKYCTECKFVFMDYENFCKFCGKKLVDGSYSCPKCGAGVLHSHPFCSNCGLNLQTVDKTGKEPVGEEEPHDCKLETKGFCDCRKTP